VGYLGYGMRDEKPRGAPSPITLPDFRLVRYAQMWKFDHAQKSVVRYEATQKLNAPISCHPGLVPGSSSATNTMLSETLSKSLGQIPAQGRDDSMSTIHNLAANITRKFFGAFEKDTSPRLHAGVSCHLRNDASGDPGIRRDDGRYVNYFRLFKTLCDASPAPYSAYIRHGDNAILSSSPECFLSIDANGRITTRPIKGSARRNSDITEDEKIRNALAASEKNLAENLMIVDLMRNDLARVSEPESVCVTEQSGLYSYATIHHLISTITAQKRESVTAYEAVRACFPAGSMTGAPKIAAMQWCTAQEKRERGVYSGAIGWFGTGNSCDLSVVIRTLIIEGNRFEFQVGGGIVADSTPTDEWRETIAKARGILAALGLSEKDLEVL
jgi:anthranilate/para-aminobenzoate synthase component I